MAKQNVPVSRADVGGHRGAGSGRSLGCSGAICGSSGWSATAYVGAGVFGLAFPLLTHHRDVKIFQVRIDHSTFFEEFCVTAENLCDFGCVMPN